MTHATMIKITPAYYNRDSDDPPGGYYIDLPMRITVYIGKRKGTWWKPDWSVFRRHK